MKFTIAKVVLDKSLARGELQSQYPDPMPFYLYATADGKLNIEHTLTKAPNAQLSVTNITLSPMPCLEANKPYQLAICDYAESMMQPLSTKQPVAFLQTDRPLRVAVLTDDGKETKCNLVIHAKSQLMIDYDFLSHEIAADVYITPLPNNGRSSIRQDIDKIAATLVNSLRNGSIVWTDNIVHALQNLFDSDPKHPFHFLDHYSVTLGIPSKLPEEGKYFAIVSRFVCKQSADPTVQSLAQNQGRPSMLHPPN